MVSLRGRLELMDIFLVKSIRSHLIHCYVFHLHFSLLLVESSFCLFTKWVDVLSLRLDSGTPEFPIFQIVLCLENQSATNQSKPGSSDVQWMANIILDQMNIFYSSSTGIQVLRQALCFHPCTANCINYLLVLLNIIRNQERYYYFFVFLKSVKNPFFF